jgi:acetylornithine/succinyldiaminopimelate/putrescine aminotransferase
VLVHERIAAKITHGEYGSTFGGGPVVMAAVEATLDVIAGELECVRRMGALLEGFRGEGLLRGGTTKRPANEVAADLRQRGILVGTSEDPHVVRVLPPLIVREEHVRRFLAAWREVA